jgi:hypothetical protein
MRQLVKSYEAWDCESDSYDHTITVWKEGDYYQVKHYARQGSFDLDSLATPNPIPMNLFKGRWHASLTEAPRPIPPDSFFLKSPSIFLPDGYGNDGTAASHAFRTPGDDMVEEAKIYEILKHHPHPNICVYYGCVRDGDHFTALCLKKYRRSLRDAIQNGDGAFEPRTVLDGISKGLHFLHDTLGIAHNDINPSNIMLDDQGNAVIIDFDSCIPIGQEIGYRKGGTFGWMKEPGPNISVPENDTYGLTLIARFMEGETTVQ